MQYHALSLVSKPGTQVCIVAYSGSAPIPELQDAPNLQFFYVPQLSKGLQQLPRLLVLFLKVLQQLAALLWLMLCRLPSPDVILMQNPPAIPTMAVCWLAATLHRAQLVIDWHNFAYTILALAPGSSRLVWLARRYEHFWGRLASKHFCVTRAMQEELATNWGVTATVLYDRPPARFRRTDLATTHSLLHRLEPKFREQRFDDFLTAELEAGGQQKGSSTMTSLTSCSGSGSGVAWRAGRPALVISSTSWTPDEDFGILWAAAQQYDRLASQPDARLPRLLLLITGKGPMQQAYMAKLQASKFARVAFRLVWLEAADYPLLLGAADLGVSLHTSSSGLDLPMKVVDMFGSGVPFCAAAYSCIAELVADQQTGLLFSTPEQLSGHLASLLQGFPSHPTRLLTHMRQQVASREQKLRWAGNWDAVAWPQLKPSLMPSKSRSKPCNK